MRFGEKIKGLREQKGWTQLELAEKLGVSLRTVSSYENVDQRPRYRSMYHRMAELFGVDVNYLLTDEEHFILSARDRFGQSGAIEAERIVDGMLGLFAGGEMTLDDKKTVLDALSEAYYIAKQKKEAADVEAHITEEEAR